MKKILGIIILGVVVVGLLTPFVIEYGVLTSLCGVAISLLFTFMIIKGIELLS